jgi:drug/metabolite transporter (DMT)-like permease
MNPHPSRLMAFASLALSMALVGSYVALSKPLVAVLPVFLLAWLRFGIGALAMPHWLKKPTGELPWSLATRWLVFAQSLLGNFFFSICMLYGVSLTSAVSAGIVMALIPAAVALLSWALLRERVTLRVWLGVALAVLSVSLFMLFKQEQTIDISRRPLSDLFLDKYFWGFLLLFGAVLCEAAYAVIGKRLTATLTPKRVAAVINLWGLVLMTPFGLYLALDFNFSGVPPGSWLLLVFYALAASVWSVWLWMTGLKSIPAAQAGVFTVMLPISSALTGLVFLGESISGFQALAFAIALAGVVLAAGSSEGKQTEKTTFTNEKSRFPL